MLKTKDELINALYRDIRLQVADAVMPGFPRRAGLRERLEHIWSRYVMWGVENSLARKALRLVSMSHVITSETRGEGAVIYQGTDSWISSRRPAFRHCWMVSAPWTPTK